MQRIGFLVLYFDVHVIFYVIMSFHLVALNFTLNDVFAFHHMSLIVSKKFLKEISSKLQVFTKKSYFHLLRIFIP